MTSGVGRQQVGRVTIGERPGALFVTAPFPSRRRAAVLSAGILVRSVMISAFAFGETGARRTAGVAASTADAEHVAATIATLRWSHLT